MHLMIDLETLSTVPESVVVSCGLVLHDNEKILAKKYYVITLQDQIDAGRKVSESTILWWLNQTIGARRVFDLENNPLKRYSALEFCENLSGSVSAFLNKNGKTWDDVNIWGNGSSFDITILEDLFRSNEVKVPWKFWNVRCFRTLDALAGVKKLATRRGEHHNALDDAIYQAECLIGYFKQVTSGDIKPRAV